METQQFVLNADFYAVFKESFSLEAFQLRNFVVYLISL